MIWKTSEEFYDHSKNLNKWHNEAENPKYKAQIKKMKALLSKVNSKWDEASNYKFQPYFVEQLNRVNGQ